MTKFYERLTLGLLLGVLALVILTACSALVAGSGVAVNLDEEDTETVVDESESAQKEEIFPEETSPAKSVGNQVNILIEDDRPEQLRRLTQAWNTNWNQHTVPYDELLSGGPPCDGIRSIDDPQFVSPEAAAAWLADNEPVIALELNRDARAYPLSIITWHEIVNDEVGGIPAVVTFCPSVIRPWLSTAAWVTRPSNSASRACCATPT